MTRMRLAIIVALAGGLAVAGLAVSHAMRKPARFANRLADLSAIAMNAALPRSDAFGRLTSYPGKVDVPCPAREARMAVLLLIGQSQTGNHAAARHVSAHGDRVAGRFAGTCQIAASPLLGTTGTWGESWTPLANAMIAAGVADRVVLVPAGIGATSISQWRAGGRLNAMMLETVKDAQAAYRITHVLWHQGENDFAEGTTAEAYREMFLSLVASLRAAGVDAPVFASVSSRCADGWTPDNPIAAAQRALPGAAPGVHAGVDTDRLVGVEDRYDGCHFGSRAQETVAAAWLGILRAHPPR